MIHLRKPSQAFIPDGSITKEKIAENAIDSTKIEDGAVDLSSAKVTGELPEEKIADSAVTENKIADNAIGDGKLKDNSVLENKIADLAISTNKLKDNVITLAKASDDVKVNPFTGGEEEQFITGDVETAIIETGFAKVGGKFAPLKLRIIASLKTNDALKEATAKIYIDEEAEARIIMNSVSTDYELVSGEADISDLSAGRHNLIVKLVNAEIDGISSNDYIDILFVK